MDQSDISESESLEAKYESIPKDMKYIVDNKIKRRQKEAKEKMQKEKAMHDILNPQQLPQIKHDFDVQLSILILLQFFCEILKKQQFLLI